MRSEGERERAPKGSVEGRYLLKLPADMLMEAKRTAKARGLSLAEWVRRLIEGALHQH